MGKNQVDREYSTNPSINAYSTKDGKMKIEGVNMFRQQPLGSTNDLESVDDQQHYRKDQAAQANDYFENDHTSYQSPRL